MVDYKKSAENAVTYGKIGEKPIYEAMADNPKMAMHKVLREINYKRHEKIEFFKSDWTPVKSNLNEIGADSIYYFNVVLRDGSHGKKVEGVLSKEKKSDGKMGWRAIATIKFHTRYI